ncbi:MAG: MFS transporter [Chloroflexi bacterium]|nr:MFS transporter [Chloroflexota bacterium]
MPNPTPGAESVAAPPRLAWFAGRSPALRRALIALCITEITSWGVLYYAFPVMLSRLTTDTGWSPEVATAAFSTGLVVSALAGVPVGRLLDRYGPRAIMTAGSVIGVGATLAVAAAPSVPLFFLAWSLVGLAQSALLYPPAFAALTRWYGSERVAALTTLSLVAGLSSTVFAPLTALLVDELDWRLAYRVLAVVLGAVTIPLHAMWLTPAWQVDHAGVRVTGDRHVRLVLRQRSFTLLMVAMVLGAFGMYAANINLVPLLTNQGADNRFAAVALGLAGVGQVMGRLGYPWLTRHTRPATRTALVLAAGAGSVALLALVSQVPTALLLAAILAGAIRGNYTLLQATSVSDRWGTHRFPTINGVFSAPATLAIALAPAGGALLAAALGTYALAFYALAGGVLVGAVIALRTEAERGEVTAPIDANERSGAVAHS